MVLDRGNEIPRGRVECAHEWSILLQREPRTLIKPANPAEFGDSRSQGSVLNECGKGTGGVPGAQAGQTSVLYS